jgi:hypothetical protein
MIYSILKGRMCNQMFQIAAAYALAIDNDDKLLCSKNTSGDYTPTELQNAKYRTTIFKNVDFGFFDVNGQPHTDPRDQSFSPIKHTNNICLSGYYQSEKYFLHRKREIEGLFAPSGSLRELMHKKYDKLLKKPNTCSVHIRRGDYLKLQDYHYNLTKEYYDHCFDNMPKDTLYVFFSDDQQWCKETYKHMNAVHIDTGFDVLDFYIMSNMKNNIIANSSFSWWAAWLNINESKKVFAPKRWFGPKNAHLDTKDLIPTRWEILDVEN